MTVLARTSYNILTGSFHICRDLCTGLPNLSLIDSKVMMAVPDSPTRGHDFEPRVTNQRPSTEQEEC
jgi:hypothetical protein